jgi:hypothetical protein
MMRMTLRMMKMKTKSKLFRLPLSATLSSAALALALTGAAAPSVHAQVNIQNGPVNRGPIERIVTGKVVNKSDVAMPGVVVYLKNSKSNAVKTFITADDGTFRFGQLSQNEDYELWADSDGTRSKSKTISSFDSKNSFYFTLKIN